MQAGVITRTLNSEAPSLPISACWTPAWNHRNQSRELEKPYHSLKIQLPGYSTLLRGMYPKAMFTLLVAGEAVSSSIQRATCLLVKLSCSSKIGHFKELSLVLHNLIVKSFSVYCKEFSREFIKN